MNKKFQFLFGCIKNNLYLCTVEIKEMDENVNNYDKHLASIM